MIEIIGQKLFKEIITEIKEAKYFSISLDSTPDIANFDKLALTFRYVHKDGPVERFTKFLDMHGHTAQDIVESFFSFMKENHLNISNCRGQSYDNASVMSGKYNGVQALIRKENALADYVPCCAHSLNLVGQSAIDCVPHVCHFFDFIQNCDTFFRASTHRWRLLLK